MAQTPLVPDLVSDHDTSTIVWGAPGKNAASLGKFFDALPEGGVERLEAVPMDLGLAYIKAVRERAPAAVICFEASCGPCGLCRGQDVWTPAEVNVADFQAGQLSDAQPGGDSNLEHCVFAAHTRTSRP